MRDGVVLSAFANRSESPLRLDAITWLECVWHQFEFYSQSLSLLCSPQSPPRPTRSDVAALASSS